MTKFKVTPMEEMSWMQRRRHEKKVRQENAKMEKYHADLTKAIADRRVEKEADTRTAKAKVLEALLKGEILTVKKAWLIAGTTELRSQVNKLRKEGYTIKSERVAGEVFHQYFMPNVK